MKKISLKIKLASMFGIFSILSGCYFGATVDNLLSPPALSKEQNEIYNALTKAIGKAPNLIYPKSGDYKSPYVIQNIDDDVDMEALVFYKTEDETNGSNIRISILDKTGGEWKSVYDHAGIGTGIERVIFSKLGKSEKTDIIVGYSMLADEKNLKVYNYTDGYLSTVYTDYYSNMFVTDLEKNNTDELIIIHPNNQDSNAFLSCVTNIDGEVAENSIVPMNPATMEFVNIAHGYIGVDTPALFIDGLSSGKLYTEIIYMINGKLRNPIYVNNNGLLENTARPTGFFCTDIDFDGIIDIPTLDLFPGYNTDSIDKEYITNWNAFENYSIVKKYQTYYNPDDGYFFMLPSRWENVVTAKTDKSTGEVVFYKYDTSLENSTSELLRFAAAEEGIIESKLENGYFKIKSGKASYLYKSAINEDEPLILTETEIINNFYIMSAE